MGAWELLLVGVVILLGLAGVLVPGLPGSWLVWAAVLWWALSDPQALSWAVLVGATAVLLLAGLTDASVAKQLDLGLRTVQRRVKGLMELAGVSTRLQLGWHAYERGWVAR